MSRTGFTHRRRGACRAAERGGRTDADAQRPRSLRRPCARLSIGRPPPSYLRDGRRAAARGLVRRAAAQSRDHARCAGDGRDFRRAAGARRLPRWLRRVLRRRRADPPPEHGVEPAHDDRSGSEGRRRCVLGAETARPRTSIRSAAARPRTRSCGCSSKSVRSAIPAQDGAIAAGPRRLAGGWGIDCQNDLPPGAVRRRGPVSTSARCRIPTRSIGPTPSSCSASSSTR